MGLFEYINETRGEMRHVSWPTRKQTVIYTSLVVGVSILTAVYLGLFDYIFTDKLIGQVLGVDAVSAPASSEVTEVAPAGSEGNNIESTGEIDVSVEGAEVVPVTIE